MHGHRFDLWTRSLADDATTRRSMFTLTAGGLLASLLKLRPNGAALAYQGCGTEHDACGAGERPCCDGYTCDPTYRICLGCRGVNEFCGSGSGPCCEGLYCDPQFGFCKNFSAATDATFVLQPADAVNEDAMTDYTGAIQLLVDGERPPLKTPSEILAIAETTDFVEEGQFEEDLGDGNRLIHVPRAFVADPLSALLFDGWLAGKIVVEGSPEEPKIPAGTYYIWVDFVDGTWGARLIEATGSDDAACYISGVQVKQAVMYGKDLAEQHNKPQVAVHWLEYEADGATQMAIKWSKYSNWVDVGSGCNRVTICVPHGAADCL